MDKSYANAAEMFPLLPSGLPEEWRTITRKTPTPPSSDRSSTSSSSSGSSPFSYNDFDPKRFVDNLYTKLIPISGEKGLHEIIGALYRAKPECFICPGSIHNSADGKDTYLSIRIYVSNTFWYNVHVYGIKRGTCFRILRTETYMTSNNENKKYVAEFNRLETVVRPESVRIW